MKIHLVVIGKPKLAYAKQGFDEYLARLQRLHTVRVSHIADKHAYSVAEILSASKGTVSIVMEITGQQYSSQELAVFLKQREIESKEISIIIGGPEGLPHEVRTRADYLWSIGKHTLPHDLAMVVTLEALYRASTINAGLPYHK